MPNRFPSSTGCRQCRSAPRSRKTGLSRLCARTAWAAVVIAAYLSAPVHAQTSQISGKVALASQLIDRGLAITPDTPVVEGAVSWTSTTGWSLGLAGGIEARSPGHLVVALARISHFWALSDDWEAQASLRYYDYGADSRQYVHDRADASASVTYRDILTVGLSAIRVIGDGDDRLRGALDLDARWPLAQHVSLSAGAGIAQTTGSSYGQGMTPSPAGHARYPHGDYVEHRTRLYGYGQLGLAIDDGPWHLELDRIMTSLDSQRSHGWQPASRWVATISRSF